MDSAFPPPHASTQAPKSKIQNPKSKIQNSFILLALLALVPGCRQETATPNLLLYCGAGLRPAVAELAEEFGRRQGATIECDYAGSEVLLGRAKLSGQGDLYLPGDASYVEQARAAGLIRTSKTVCYFVPVILVQKGNPKKIEGLKDLLRPGIKLGLGDAKACAVGRQSAAIFAANKIPEADVDRNVVMRSLTVNELGNHIKLRALDATIVWDAVAAGYTADADVVPIPASQNVISEVSAGILTSSGQPELAARFLDFLTSPAAAAVFQKHRYATARRPAP